MKLRQKIDIHIDDQQSTSISTDPTYPDESHDREMSADECTCDDINS